MVPVRKHGGLDHSGATETEVEQSRDRILAETVSEVPRRLQSWGTTPPLAIEGIWIS